MVFVIVVANQVSLWLLIQALVTVNGSGQAHDLLLAAAQVWLTNIIAFGLAFWELDRGGPDRARSGCLAVMRKDAFPPS